MADAAEVGLLDACQCGCRYGGGDGKEQRGQHLLNKRMLVGSCIPKVR